MKKYLVEDEKGRREVEKKEFELALKRIGRFRESKRFDEGRWRSIAFHEGGHRKFSLDGETELVRVGVAELRFGEERQEKKTYPPHLCQKCGGKKRVDQVTLEKYCESCGNISGSM